MSTVHMPSKSFFMTSFLNLLLSICRVRQQPQCFLARRPGQHAATSLFQAFIPNEKKVLRSWREKNWSVEAAVANKA